MNLLINPDTCGAGLHSYCEGEPCECPCGHNPRTIAITMAANRSPHAVHGGWDFSPAGDAVCALDGDVILRASEVPS